MYLYDTKRLVYYDDFYRLAEIEYFDYPEKNTTVIGTANGSSGCYINTGF